MRSALVIGAIVASSCGCQPSSTEGRRTTPESATATVTATGSTVPPKEDELVRSPSASEKGLEIWLEIQPKAKADGSRTFLLHFKNTTGEPLRIYLPQGEAFRMNISTVTLFAGKGAPIFAPDPHPHGYVVTEVDFPLLAAGEEKVFEQPFWLDEAIGNGPPKRREGFEPGATIDVRWTYESSITKWAGGVQTLDGPTKSLFDGKEIPHIWTGKVKVETKWKAP